MPAPATILLLAPAAIGIVYTLAAAMLAGRWRAPPPVPPSGDPPAVSILKPLYGAEPALAANLQGFLDQDYAAPVEMICGVQDREDPAIPIVRALRRGAAALDLCLDPRRHGVSGKVSNLVNMTGRAANPLLVLSDSDIAVTPDYLARIAGAMDRPGVGAVTCLYAGRGDAGGWSRLAAAGISYQFLPSLIVGLALGLAKPCMGSTIAIRRDTLDRIGGFVAFADTLADDYAIGAAVRALGLEVVVPPMIVTHGCDESSLRALVRHELRWNATVRGLDPLGFAGSVVTYPVVLALPGFLAGAKAGAALLAAALVARLLLAWRIDRLVGRCTVSPWLLPARDVLSFGLFVAAFFVRSVDWRGSRLKIMADGQITAEQESPP